MIPNHKMRHNLRMKSHLVSAEENESLALARKP